MARPLEIKIDADARGAERAAEDLADSLDEVVKELDRMADEGDDAAADLAASFRKIERDAGDAGDKVKRDIGGGFKEAGGEAAQSGREAAASFSGGFDDIGDFVQETLANAFGGFGVLGAAGGLAAALGVGIAIEQLDKAKERVQELRDAAGEVADSAIDEGLDVSAFMRQADQVIDRLREIQDTEVAWPWEDISSSDLARVNDALEGSGRTLSSLYQGSTDDLEELLRVQRRLYGEEQARSADYTNDARERSRFTEEEMQAKRALIDELEGEVDARRSAEGLAKEQADAGITAMLDEAAAAEEWADTLTAARDAVADEAEAAFDRMRDAATDYATAEDGAFDIGRWLDYVEEQKGAVESYQENLQSMKLSPDEWSNLLSLPEDSRVAIVNSYATATDSDRARIAEALADPGGEGGKQAAVKFDENFTPEADVEITTDTAAADKEIDRITKAAKKKVTVDLDAVNARSGISSLLRKKTLPVAVALDRSAWDNWNPPAKTATVYVRRQELD